MLAPAPLRKSKVACPNSPEYLPQIRGNWRNSRQSLSPVSRLSRANIPDKAGQLWTLDSGLTKIPVPRLRDPRLAARFVVIFSHSSPDSCLPGFLINLIPE